MYTAVVVKAVIDVGSNSVLLLVAEFDGKEWNQLFESTFVTALGKGTKASKLLSEEGMARTLEALKTQFDQARTFGSVSIKAAATMAARIATNTPVFLERAERQQTPVQILSGEDEAKFGFEAIVNDPKFYDNEVISIIDVGGHSTELVTAFKVGRTWHTQFRNSFPIGALGLREGVLSPDIPDFGNILAAVSEIDDVIGLRYLPHMCGAVVTLGATGTNLISIRDRLTTWNPDYVHGKTLDYEEISKSAATLSSLGDEGRSKVIGIEPGRQYTLHAGALILERFLFAIGANHCQVSTKGWRHGYIQVC